MEILDDADFSESGPTYPWADWTDGQVRRATQGIDFQCKRDSFIASLYSYKKRHGIEVAVRRVGNDSVEFRFSK